MKSKMRWSHVGGQLSFALLVGLIIFQVASGQTNTFPASGNVGIGTTSPATKLDVSTSVAGGAINFPLIIANRNTVADARAGLLFQVNALSTKYGAAIYAANDGVTGAGHTVFGTFVNDAFTERMRINASGNVGIGTTAPEGLLDLKGSNIPYIGQLRISASDYAQITFYDSANLAPNGANRRSYIFHDIGGGSFNIGSTGNIILRPATEVTVNGNLAATGTINAKYQDMAEWVPSSERLTAGTVVVLDAAKSNQVVSSTSAYDTRVAGVISSQPGITLGEKSEHKVLVATTGRVKVKVDASRGPIAIGDLLVTSDLPGVAMRSEPVDFAGRKMHLPGTIVGKALEPLAKGTGEILVLLSLQ